MKLFKYLTAALLSVSFFSAKAEITKETTINIIVPRAAGSPQDSISRLIQHELANHGYKVIIINKPGGSDSIAINELRKNPNTDDNVYIMSATHSDYYHYYYNKEPKYNIEDFFKPVIYVNEFDMNLLVPKELGIKTYDDLFSYMENPDVFVKTGSSALGSSGHLLAYTILGKYGDKVAYIPYKSDAENFLALLRGDLSFSIVSTAAYGGYDKLEDEFNIIKSNYPLPIWHAYTSGPDLSYEDRKELNRIINLINLNQELMDKIKPMSLRGFIGGDVEYFDQVIKDTIEAGKKLPIMIE